MTAAAPQPLRLGSSWRSLPAAQTLALGQRLMPALGISRVTDITRMDRLGLPVFASVRPRGRALCVHAGKGVQAIEAQVGALMEAVEYAAAEPQRSDGEIHPLSVADLVAQFGPGLRFVDLVPQLGLRIEPGQVLAATPCEDLARGGTTWLPAEIVFVPFAGADVPRVFGWTSNGLASGNSVDEATLHGLLEVLERDATAMNKPQDVSQWVAHEGLCEPFRSLAAQWRSLGIELAVRFVPNAFGLPCFEAWLHDTSGGVPLATGSGLHLDRDIALARAVCEAAQSRLTYIHGGRDDITRHHDRVAGTPAAQRHDEDRRELARVFDRQRQTVFDMLPHEPGLPGTLAVALDALLSRLARAGFEHVLRHRFAGDLGGLHVVKVIVPRCEEVEHNRLRIGPRLLAGVVGHA